MALGETASVESEQQKDGQGVPRKGLLSKREQARRLAERLASLQSEIDEDEKRERERNAARLMKILRDSGLAYINVDTWAEKLPEVRRIVEAG